MNINFDRCMEMLLEHEGGYVNGNRIGDPGGITNMGVTNAPTMNTMASTWTRRG